MIYLSCPAKATLCLRLGHSWPRLWERMILHEREEIAKQERSRYNKAVRRAVRSAAERRKRAEREAAQQAQQQQADAAADDSSDDQESA